MRIDIQPDQVEVQVRPNAIAYLTLDEFKPDPRLTGPVETLAVPARLKRTGREIRRIEQGAQRDYGQRFFWKPGKTTPERGPDLGAAVGW